MEPHPIPQNVTSFQFHLVGDMTLKQFVYLSAGVGFAYLLFISLAHSYPLMAWPLIIISASLGIAFAFLPVGSRPLDYWLQAFLKAIYSPTKRSWKKGDKTYLEDPLFNSRLVMYTSGSAKPVDQGISESVSQKSETLTHRPTDTLIPSAPPTPHHLPTPEDLKKTVDLARQAQTLQVQIIQTERNLNQIKDAAGRPSPIPVDYSQQVNKILADLQRLVGQASTIRQQLDAIGQPPKPTGQPLAQPTLPKEKIKVVIPIKPRQTQVALTSFPNVINGIVKDVEGNLLDSVVVVIYDKEGLPVRALKTNKLGQFSGATPLPNGTYNLELEKEGYNFDVLQIELGGSVVPPLMITAK